MAKPAPDQRSMRSSPALKIKTHWARVVVIPVFCIVCLLWTSSLCPAQNDASPLQKDFQILFERFKQRSDPLDYVIVIDRSNSMQKYWNSVLQGIIEFVNVVNEGDYVSFVLFGEEAPGKTDSPSTESCIKKPAIPGRLISSSRVRSDITLEIRNLCKPSGGNTDLGEALEKALNELNRPGGHDLKVAFFFTDFIHTPKNDSKYANKYSGTEAWQQLAQRRRNELSSKTVLSYAMLLDTGKETGRDLPLAQAVFPDLERVSVNESTIKGYLNRITNELNRERLKAVVKRELTSPPTVTNIYPRENQLLALVEFQSSQISTTNTISEVSVSDLEAGNLNVYLTPIPTHSKEYAVDPTSRKLELPIAIIKTNSLLAWRETAPISFTLRAKRHVSPAPEIAKLNLPTLVDFDVPATSAPVTLAGGRFGYAGWTLIALSLALVIGVLQRRTRKEFIVGTFMIRDAGRQAIKHQRFTKKDKQTEFAIGEGVLGNHSHKVAGADWQLRFYSVSPGLLGQRGTYLEVKRGSAEFIVGGRKERLQPHDPPKLLRRLAFVKAGNHSVEFIGR